MNPSTVQAIALLEQAIALLKQQEDTSPLTLEAAIALYGDPDLPSTSVRVFPKDDKKGAEQAHYTYGGYLLVEPWGFVVSDDDEALAHLIAYRFGGDRSRAQRYILEEMEAFYWSELEKP